MTHEPLVGVFPDMPNEEHHAHPAIGSTGLKLLEQSPLHYWAAYRDQNREPKPSTPEQRLGRLTHTAALEPHRVEDTFVVLPEGLNRSTKEGKALWADIVATGREPIKTTELERLKSMASAIHAHPVTRVLFQRCAARTEVSIFWVDAETGVNCKIRPDILVEPCEIFPNGLIVDLKTTGDASAAEFARTVWNWEMYLQAALYPAGFMAAFGTAAPPDFLWLAQEKDTPFANAFYQCTEKLSAYGRRKVRAGLRELAKCERTGIWPGYPQQVAPIELPGWADKIIEDAVATA